MTRSTCIIISATLLCAFVTCTRPLEGRAASQMCMNQGGKVVVLQPGSGSAGNAEAYPCPATSSSGSSSGGSPGAGNSPGTSSQGAAADGNPISGILSSIANLQSMHDHALAIHSEDVQRDVALTSLIEQNTPAVQAYLGSGNIILSAFASPFVLPKPAPEGVQYAWMADGGYTNKVIEASRDFWLQRSGQTHCTVAIPACVLHDRWLFGIVLGGGREAAPRVRPRVTVGLRSFDIAR